MAGYAKHSSLDGSVGMKYFILLMLLIITRVELAMSDEQPCLSAEYRQFDFWLGEWDVYDENKQLVGHNHIFTVLEGCALSENWSSVAGSPGKSYSFYDVAENKWHQTWVDQSGGALYLDGGLVDGKMIMSGARPDGKGGSRIERLSWTPLSDGRVRQHWQSSSDKGATWDEVFDGYYQRKEKPQ